MDCGGYDIVYDVVTSGNVEVVIVYDVATRENVEVMIVMCQKNQRMLKL